MELLLLPLLASVVASTSTPASTWEPTPSSGTTPSPEVDIGSPLRVAQCRAFCIQKFHVVNAKESSCLQKSDCFMCWENCELLQSNFAVWGAMCSEKSICYPGCQRACEFHRQAAGRSPQPVTHTHGRQVVRLSGAEARWPPPPPPVGRPPEPVVYVVMGRSSSGWKQLAQTIELKCRLPPAPLDTTSLRVLVVDAQGLVTIYSPAEADPDTPPLETRSVDQDASIATPARKRINTEVASTPVAMEEWTLRQVSLIHQTVLVIAEVAWRAPDTDDGVATSGGGVYLVTWEVDGGGLRGNLFTDSTCVTLSLWPDTIYHIQVELVSRTSAHRPLRSRPLVLDTHRAATVSPPPPRPGAPGGLSGALLSVLVENRTAAPDRRHRREVELVAATSAVGVALLGAALLGAAVAWRRLRLRGGGGIAKQRLVDDMEEQQQVRTADVKEPLSLGFANPLLFHAWQQPSLASTPGVGNVAHASSFLRDARRCASNEVQV